MKSINTYQTNSCQLMQQCNMLLNQSVQLSHSLLIYKQIYLNSDPLLSQFYPHYYWFIGSAFSLVFSKQQDFPGAHYLSALITVTRACQMFMDKSMCSMCVDNWIYNTIPRLEIFTLYNFWASLTSKWF